MQHGLCLPSMQEAVSIEAACRWLRPLTVGGLHSDVAVACGAQACGVQLGVGALLLGREASQLLAWEAV